MILFGVYIEAQTFAH